jgi:hypothetical protein
MGTVAFGSLIIALIQMARLVLEYIKRKYSKDVGRIGRWIMCCFSCCLWCLEKCMKYVQMHLLFPHPLVYSLSHALAFCNAPHSLTNPLFHPPSRTPTRPTEFTLPPFIFRPHRPASTSCIMQCGLTTEKLHSPPPPPHTSRYVNKNAYIITNIHGYPFCSAAFTALSDLMSNALLVFAINGIGFLVITLFKVS